MDRYRLIKRRVFEIIEKANSKDIASKVFDTMIYSLILLNTLAIVLESFNSISQQYGSYFKIFEVISVIIFSIEYFLRIWTADLLYPNKKGIIRPKLKYIFSLMALIDLVAILPFYLPMFIKIDLRFLRMFRLFRLLRVLKLNRYTKSLNLILNVLNDKKNELIATISMMFFMIVISATIMYYFETEVQPEAFPNIIASIWWAIATLTTVGYGDVYPITILGKIFASIIAILGIGLVALPTGIISSGFIEVISEKNSKKKKKAECCPHCGKDIHNNDD